MNIITNNVPRNIIEGYELTTDERADFDYYAWPDVNASYPYPLSEGEQATFFRYKGRLYDLGEFMAPNLRPDGDARAGWDGYMCDTYFSGILVKLEGDERVIVARFWA